MKKEGFREVLLVQLFYRRLDFAFFDFITSL